MGATVVGDDFSAVGASCSIPTHERAGVSIAPLATTAEAGAAGGGGGKVIVEPMAGARSSIGGNAR
ncbi:hypothetical protein [Nocardia sp. NPDC058633]|uniref:hypothetical protein n=1 Tax=Nocardia sp. NPDC058633 TaxID=3346568 RepID=UPI0036625FD1